MAQLKSLLTQLWSQLLAFMGRMLGGRIHPEGFRFIIISVLLTFVLFFISEFLGWIGVLVTIWCCWFFRDPARVSPQRTGLVVSPADGVVSAIEEAVPPPELELGLQKRVRISIFMNIFNCHINRMPIAGKILKIAYREGRFFNATFNKASDDNERNTIHIQIADDEDIIVTQIAGLIARRIVCFVEGGETYRTGARLGLIRFGSRVDVYLPEGIQTLVGVGQIMVGGETILADTKRKERIRKMFVS